MFRAGIRTAVVLAVTAAGVLFAVLAAATSWWWLVLAVPLLAVGLLGCYDLSQSDRSVLRNYPVLGHLRYLFEGLRPEIQQYFIERNFDGRPYDRDVRSIVYQRSKGIEGESPFGTERDVYADGYEFFAHSMSPHHAKGPIREHSQAGTEPAPEEPPRIHIGGPDCKQPYDMSLLNVSAMSFGSLSANAIVALSTGAAKGGFAHDTGEGGMSDYHLAGGADLIWEVGTAYFGCRTPDGDFDPVAFKEKAANPRVKMVSLKLSQGAKPGLGGVLPGEKVNAEIARVRDVPLGKTVVSPPYHRVFSTPRELVLFIDQMRELSGGKPAGFKLCVGTRRDVLAVCKAMLDEQITPDFIVVDGAEGGTGAAPLEFTDHVGMPLTEGLFEVHNALVGCGLRDRIKIGVSGKVATGSDMVKRMIQGADYTNAARAMMFAVGCIQAQRCHTNRCPVGVATQDPRRSRALYVPDKSERVFHFQQATVHSAMKIMFSLGVSHPDQLRPHMLYRRVSPQSVRSYAELCPPLRRGQLLDDPPADWAQDWKLASPDSFAV
ncbi:FMN-binding glutamate synthase family protein [Fodinicola feengrottensis]|uniref:FMN-binding glutamate synthase family protein n=1 Tax=Fodinicola feengrottensis TaxID=435914 RepID=UPI003CD07712